MSEFKHKLILYTAILSLLIIVFVQRSCSAQTPQTTKQKVIVPEKKGEFTTSVAIFHKKEKKDSIVYKTIVVKTENPVNKELVEKLKEALKKKDTTSIIELYGDAIGEREETQVFDNKDINLEIKVRTRGELLELKPKYTIKEREEVVQVKQKETVFAVYVGGGLKTNIELGELSPTVNLGIQNKRGSIIYGQYGLDKSFQIGYNFRILNIKK